MTPLDAVAAAIRERLLAGRPAPLPGLGTLVRQHVASRIQERADGTRMLMPPGETIGLASQGSAEHESLGVAFGRFQGLDGAQAVRAYRDAMDQIEARLSATGEVRLPGVGLLRRTSGGIILGVEADLLAAVNRTYEGLAPVGAAPSPPPSSVPPPETPTEPAQPKSAPPSTTPPDVEVTVVGTSQDDAFGVPIHSALEADDVETETPLRDLSSVPGSPPFAPPGFSAPTDAPSPTTESAEDGASDVPSEPTRPEPEVEAAEIVRLDEFVEPSAVIQPETEAERIGPVAELDEASQPVAEADEVVPAEPMSDSVGDDPDAAIAEEPPTSAAFVDEHTLDADLDELAVPFGAGAPLSEILPPTPAPEESSTSQAAARPDPEVDLDEPSATNSLLSYADGDTEPEIEDAAYEIVEPDPAPVIERVGPSADLDALLAAPAPGDETAFPAEPRATDPFADLDLGEDPPVPAEVEAPPVDAAPSSRGSFPWWLVALAVLLAFALLLAWLWPRFATRTADAAAPTEQTLPGPTRIQPASTQPDDDDSAPAQPEVRTLDAPRSGVQPDAPETEGRGDASASAPPAPRASGGGVARDDDPLPARPGLGQAPAAGYAISPPRVVGLSGADVRALSGRDAVDPTAAAWTLVVLSTASRDDANALSARYRSAGYRTGVVASADGDRTMYRVAVGQFSDRAQARRLRDRLPPQAPADSWPLDLRTL